MPPGPGNLTAVKFILDVNKSQQALTAIPMSGCWPYITQQMLLLLDGING